MQYSHHKFKLAAFALSLLLGTSSCGYFETEPLEDPNNPGLDAVLSNANKAQLDALAVGVEASYRIIHTTNAPYNWLAGTLGREITVLAATESRWYGELQGTRPSLDDAAYYNAYYIPLAQTRRAAQVFRQSAANSQALTDEQKQGVAGFTHTYEALAKLLLLNMQGDQGIRIDLDDPLKPGKFVSEAEAFTNIRQLLDQGASELDAAGTSFGFPLSAGYTGFSTPATFKQFNRGLAARVALYQRDYAGAKTALATSFYNPTGSLTAGPKVVFNPAIAGDQGNAYFQVTNNTGTNVVGVPDNFVTEAETGDARLVKVGLRSAPRVTGGITANYEARVFTSNTSSLDIMRNEELILISAEAKANTNDLAGALADVNVIRTRSGSLPALTVPFGSVEQATNEILKQRRYSLFYEGHYFVDLRRTGRLRPIVSPGQTLAYSTGPYILFSKMPRPAAEKAWDSVNP
ncbi:RagB/SusD family nutrient uptake outer membrane protein [uncultured Hymenobacter sp.]|uniref:RagB/SusD family nutrient uptake outer membrane protein n=1 Tax=uncultured Hymenobacter sp. TaxID=170016 RepID=UPI0035CC4354